MQCLHNLWGRKRRQDDWCNPCVNVPKPQFRWDTLQVIYFLRLSLCVNHWSAAALWFISRGRRTKGRKKNHNFKRSDTPYPSSGRIDGASDPERLWQSSATQHALLILTALQPKNNCNGRACLHCPGKKAVKECCCVIYLTSCQ